VSAGPSAPDSSSQPSPRRTEEKGPDGGVGVASVSRSTISTEIASTFVDFVEVPVFELRNTAIPAWHHGCNVHLVKSC
jgi:hypothetical protein